MTSPFPGMDPYLETHWGDVHTSIAVYSRNQLQGQMPPELRARVCEELAAEPDFSTDIEAQIQRSVIILDTRSEEPAITKIEILGPCQKLTDAGRRQHRAKQRDVWCSGTNLVEIDLLRVGDWLLPVPLERIPKQHLQPYGACVKRADRHEAVEFYPISLRERLPAIRIPLRPSDADAVLDLQGVIELAYENGGYEELDYARDPVPPLRGEDASWAGALLREKGLR